MYLLMYIVTNFFQLIEIYHQDQFLGRVRERPICICQDKHLEVFNDSDEKIYDINGPWCYCECLKVPFDVSCELVNYNQLS